MAFAFGFSATFAHGHWIGPALFIFILICVLGYLGYYGVKDSAILPLLMLLFITTDGAGAASLRSYKVWAPALSYPYYGEVQGVIRTIDRSASGSLRVTSRVLTMDPISELHRPQYVRISFTKYAGDIPEIGHSIKTTAYITPPQGPVELDGFDFRRHAYFQSLVGVGYARKGFEQIDAPREQRFWKDAQRRLSNFIAEHMPERSLGFAQAIISGDRLNLSLQVIEDLRRTNLAHLPAISGLHMGLLTTLVFGLLHMICVVIPIGHFRWHARSIAAFGAILAGVAYLGLSGNSIATKRTFVMID